MRYAVQAQNANAAQPLSHFGTAWQPRPTGPGGAWASHVEIGVFEAAETVDDSGGRSGQVHDWCGDCASWIKKGAVVPHSLDLKKLSIVTLARHTYSSGNGRERGAHGARRAEALSFRRQI